MSRYGRVTAISTSQGERTGTEASFTSLWRNQTGWHLQWDFWPPKVWDMKYVLFNILISGISYISLRYDISKSPWLETHNEASKEGKGQKIISLDTLYVTKKIITPDTLCLTSMLLLLSFSLSVMSDSLWLHELQHTRLRCPSLSPGVCSKSCLLDRWCHPTISSFFAPFSSCTQSFPASGSFPVTQLFSSGSQSIGASASASILPRNIQGWFP